MAQPFEVEGAMKWALRPLGRIARPFLTPRTSVERLIRTQSSTDPAFPCSSGMFQWDGTGMSAASGKRARIARPTGKSLTAGS